MTLRAALLGPGAPRLPSFLLVAFALRLPGVFLQTGYEFVDQQYQSVDPAWHLATGQDWLVTWEWIDGIRSWVYPGLLAGVFTAARAAGLEDAASGLLLARLLHAVFSLLPLAALWWVLVRWRPVDRPRPVLWLAAGCGLLAWTGLQTSAPTWAAILTVTGVLLFHGPGRVPPLLAGLCVGLAFCGRFQDALLGPVLLLGALLAGRRGGALWFAVGTLPPVLLQGMVDLWTWGGFLHGPFAYVEMNLVLGAADQWDAQPPWFYAAVAAGLLLLVPPIWGAGWRTLRRGTAALPWATVAALAYLLAHSFVARKAFRFVLPALVLLLLVQAAGLFASVPQVERRRWTFRVYRALAVAVALLSLVLGQGYSPHRGPVDAARFLSRQAGFHDELVVVGGNETSVGGFAHLDRPRIEIEVVPREAVLSWLRNDRGEHWVMAVREPLPAHPRLDLRGAFTDVPDFKRRCRRWIYRVAPAD